MKIRDVLFLPVMALGYLIIKIIGNDKTCAQRSTTMRHVVWISWKDITNPHAGGAETVHHRISRRLAGRGYAVTHLVAGYRNCQHRELIDGIVVIRIGHSVLSFFLLPIYYVLFLRSGTDYLIDAFIGLGSFASVTMPGRASLMVHHIESTKWFVLRRFAGVPAALVRLANVLGFFAERVQLRLLALFGVPVITVSESTRQELLRNGFSKVDVMQQGIAVKPVSSLTASLNKAPAFTVLSIGQGPAKNPIDVIKAVRSMQTHDPSVCLWLVGEMTAEVTAELTRLPVRNLTVHGRVTEEQKYALMQQAHVLCTASTREGWGLVVTEANACGTPVVGYDAPGLRDSLAAGCNAATLQGLEGLIHRLNDVLWIYRHFPAEYERIRDVAWRSTHRFSFDKTTDDFLTFTGIAYYTNKENQ